MKPNAPGAGRGSGRDASSGKAPLCVWMSAGVLDYWLCPLSYDCEHCVLDRVLSGRRSLRESGRSRFGADTELHLATGRPLDLLGVPIRRRRGLYYHPLHLWGCAVGPSRVRIGLDDVSARLLATADGWTLPRLGATVGEGDSLAVTEVDGAPLRICNPLPGHVLARNDAISRFPAMAAWCPYDTGWLVEIGTDLPLGAISGFMNDEAVVSHWFDRELERLSDCAEDPLVGADPMVGETLADGGIPCADLRTLLGPTGVHAALRTFFPQ